MPRVLYVHHTSVVGGAEKSLEELLVALDRSVWEPGVVLPGPGPLWDLLAAHDVRLFKAPLTRLYRTTSPVMLARLAARYAAASVHISGIIERWRPDLLHANTTIGYLWAGPVARTRRVPAVWHVRDLKRRPRVECELLRLAGGVVSISRAVHETLPRSGRADLLTRVIHNGLDVQRFAATARPGKLRGDLRLPPETRLIVCASQLVPWKGIDTLIEAFGLLGPHRRNVALAVVGDDLFGRHQDYVARLEKLARTAGAKGAVRFTGYRSDMADVLSDADIVAVPSRAEPFGRIALEAMALAKPVVGTCAGGLPEIVLDGRTGLLVPPEDPAALAGALRRLLEQPACAAELGRAGQRRVIAEFTISKHARRIEALYTELLARHRRA